MRKMIGYVGLAILLANLTAAFMAYFVLSFDPNNKQWSDGLGRTLIEAPWLVQFVWRQDQWAGMFWFAVDMVVFWTSLFLALGLMAFGFKRPT